MYTAVFYVPTSEQFLRYCHTSIFLVWGETETVFDGKLRGSCVSHHHPNRCGGPGALHRVRCYGRRGSNTPPSIQATTYVVGCLGTPLCFGFYAWEGQAKPGGELGRERHGYLCSVVALFSSSFGELSYREEEMDFGILEE